MMINAKNSVKLAKLGRSMFIEMGFSGRSDFMIYVYDKFVRRVCLQSNEKHRLEINVESVHECVKML